MDVTDLAKYLTVINYSEGNILRLLTNINGVVWIIYPCELGRVASCSIAVTVVSNECHR